MRAAGRAAGAVLAVVLVIALFIYVEAQRPFEDAGEVGPATTVTTWTGPETFCVEGLEHRVFVGPTNGIAAPSIDVVEWDPTCR